MKYKAVIFDMDGTILNTLEDIKISLNYSLSTCGFAERTLTEVRNFVGHGIRHLVELSVPNNCSLDETNRVFDLFNQHYAVHCADNTNPYDGIVEAIKLLREKGIKTAVVSNKTDYGVQSLCKQYFDGLFDYAVGSCDGIRKKPYPDSVNAVLEKFKIHANEAVYIGDSEVDVETGINANMDCILVDWGYRDIETLVKTGAKVIVSNTQKLLDKIM